MKGAIMLSGGGSGKLFAAIGVTYPVGSTLTCTKGSKTLRAKGDSGQWIFSIPEDGEWTLTATDKTDPSKTKSQKVNITSEGQFETISLTFELVLFDSGSKVEWSSYVRIASDNFCSIANTIVCRRNSGVSLSYTGAVAYTYEPILLDGYSTLNVRFKSVSGLSSYIGVVNPSVSDKDNPSAWAASSECSVAAYGGGGTATLDISDCSGQTLAVVLGEGYVKNETGSSCEVDRVWLS
jgi:hypothetical protein